VFAFTVDDIVTVMLDVDGNVQVWPLMVQLALPSWMDNCVGSTMLMKLPLISLFFIVNAILYEVIAFTSVSVGMALANDITPATHCTLLVVFVYIAYPVPLST
jgi:hypothetical protein